KRGFHPYHAELIRYPKVTFRAYRAYRALFSSNRCPALGDDDSEAQHRDLQPLATCRSDFVKNTGS
ncbi:MAG TPA: hypothetical protein VGM27_06635, partial [Acidobacteriaceae bacterium]